jgi:predicted nucleic acid-binding Zn ribbon protein
MEQRNCLLCNKTIRGRTDKKFCDDYCRNAYNNSRKMINCNEVRRINNVLAKNRKILDSFAHELSANYFKVKTEILQDMGYALKYQTQSTTMKDGLRLTFCYDYYYFQLEKEWMIVAKML